MTQENKSEVAVPTRSPLFGLAEKFNLEPGKLMGILKGTVIKPDSNGKEATNEEVAAFCVVAQQYGLNPFTGQIHAFAKGGTVVPIVGIDGWAHIVNTHGDFDGCEFEYHEDGGNLTAITCHMHSKSRKHPVSVTEWLSECKRNTIPWNTMERRMLRHKAYIQAARYAFGLSGIYDEDEGRDIIQNKSVIIEREPITMPKAIEPGEVITEGEPPVVSEDDTDTEWACGCGALNTRRSPYCETCGLYYGEDSETGRYYQAEEGKDNSLFTSSKKG